MSARLCWSLWVLKRVLLPATQDVWPDLHLLWHPTQALPGSAAKVAVLQQRQLLRIPLHHPLDARLSSDEGYRPASVGGEWTALALLRERHDGRVEVVEEKYLEKRKRSAAERERRRSAEVLERERQRGGRRRARRVRACPPEVEAERRQPGLRVKPTRKGIPRETDGPSPADD